MLIVSDEEFESSLKGSNKIKDAIKDAIKSDSPKSAFEIVDSTEVVSIKNQFESNKFDEGESNQYDSTKEDARTAVVIPILHGRPKGLTNVPESLRKIIGEDSISGASPSDIIEHIPVSASSISAYKNSATSTASYHEPSAALEEHLTGVKKKISKRAIDKLELALGGITEDKIAAAKLKDLSSVARDMSQIVKNMETTDEGDNKGNTNIIFYTPNLRKPESFETIQLED